MRLTMKMTKLILAIEMQMEGLNILNVLISKGAVSSFERIRGRESEMNNKINARVQFEKSFDRDISWGGIYSQESKQDKQTKGYNNPQTAASIEFPAHYR